MNNRMIRFLKQIFLRKEFEYYDNGFVKVFRSFFRNVPEGKWKYYKPDGTIERILEYSNGSVVVEYFYTHDGLLYQKKWYSSPTRVEVFKSEIREYFSSRPTIEHINEYVGNNPTNKVVVLLAIEFEPKCIKYVDESLKKDKEVVLAAVSKNGMALKYADESLKKDKDFVLAAVTQNVTALEYADESLKKDKEVVLAAVTQHGSALEYADESLKKDKEVVLAAVTQSGILALKYADESLKKDKEVVLASDAIVIGF